MAGRWTMMHKVFAAAVIAVGVAGVAGTPARADGWHGHERHEWREHEWREHHPWGYRYYAPQYSYYSGYYYAPPPPVYVPPPARVYVPPPPVYVPPAASFSVVIPLR